MLTVEIELLFLWFARADITACGEGEGAVGTLLCVCQSKGKHLLFFKGRKELCAHFVTYLWALRILYRI